MEHFDFLVIAAIGLYAAFSIRSARKEIAALHEDVAKLRHSIKMQNDPHDLERFALEARIDEDCAAAAMKAREQK